MTDTTDERILTAAEELFAENGYGGTTTRALAKRAGVNEVTIFRRFHNKMGVLEAVAFKVGAAAMAQQAAAGDVPDAPGEALRQVAMRDIRNSAEHGAFAMRIAFDARSIPEIGEKMGEGPGANLAALAGLLEGWQRDGRVRDDIDARVMAEAFSSLTSSVVMFRHVMGLAPTGDMTTEELATQLAEVFLGGVLAKSEGDR